MRTFFDESNRLERLSLLGDRLEGLKAAVKFEEFRPILNEVYASEDNRAGGRQKWDAVLMFKIMILQKLYNISDDVTEYQINDRLSFQRFLNLGLGDKVPDAKTIWMYKEKLTESGRYKDLFALFNKMLEEKEIITRKGSIVDATIVQRPQQRYNKEQKAREKKGEAEGFEEKNPHRKSQTDTDAKYGVKHGKCYFGYKNHIKMDKDSKIITAIEVTDAATGDGKMIVGMVDEKDEVLYADSAYRGKNIEEEILNKNEKIELMICEKAEKNHPLTEEQKANNTKKAKIRCRVEHVFGHIVKSMGGKLVRRVGIVRTRCEIYLKNLAYNLSRWTFLSRQRDKSTQTG